MARFIRILAAQARVVGLCLAIFMPAFVKLGRSGGDPATTTPGFEISALTYLFV
jgi:hypothetical protein